MKVWIKELDQTHFSRGKYSQSYQDQLLSIIFKNIPPANQPPYCVEFGFNVDSLSGGSGANVANLVTKKNWKALLLDGGNENPDINLHRHFLTSENICDIFERHNVPETPDYISIDVDSTDLWLFDAVLKKYRASVFSVEYNSHFPLDEAITFRNTTEEHYTGDTGYGASLKALTLVAEKNGYSLLWVIPKLDAFFIRNDLIEDGSGEICFPFEKWENATNLIHHRGIRNEDRLSIFIDYECYLESSGDLKKAQDAAYPVCKKYLTRRKYRLWELLPKSIRLFLMALKK